MTYGNSTPSYEYLATHLLRLMDALVTAHGSCFFPLSANIGEPEVDNEDLTLSYDTLYSNNLVDIKMINAYQQKYCKIDPFHPKRLERSDKSVFTLEMVMKQGNADHNDYYNGFLRENGYAYEADIFLKDNTKIVAGIALLRKEHEGPFTELELAKLEAAVPFISFTLVSHLTGANNDHIEITSKDFYLTKKQIEICHMVAEGKTNKEIAADLHSSPLTIKTHLRNIFEKTNVSNRAELIATLFNHSGNSVTHH